MSRKKKERSGECAYCGKTSSLTRDHVVPTCLHGPTAPQNAVIVWACERCNNAKSRYDEILRDYLVLDGWGSRNPTADLIMRTKVARAVRKGRSALFKRLLESGKHAPFKSKGGILLGEFVQAEIDPEWIRTPLVYIVRGLHYRVKGTVLNPNYDFEVQRFFPDAWSFLNELLATTQFSEWNGIGNVFAAKYVFASDYPDLGLWTLIFYERIVFTVYVDDPNAEPEPIPESGEYGASVDQDSATPE